jgi:hypothetical protein
MPGETGQVRVEATVAAAVASVWRAWTTSQGAETFFAERANIDLRLGGPYEIFFNPADERMSTKGRKVLSQPFAKRGGSRNDDAASQSCEGFPVAHAIGREALVRRRARRLLPRRPSPRSTAAVR